MAAITGVYKITSPNDRVYIGSSINIRRRWKDYNCLRKGVQTRLYYSFKKYGYKNHLFEIIEKCDVTILLEREAYWGKIYNCLDRKRGLNSRLPKIGEVYNCCSEELKEKYRKNAMGHIPWNKGMPTPQKTKNKISETLKGNIPWNKGGSFSEESKKKMSNSTKGAKAWNEKIVLDMETGVFYDSISYSARTFNIKRSTLQAMLGGTNRNKTNLKII